VLLEHDLIDELYLTLYPLTLGGGKRILPAGLHRSFRLLSAKPYPTGVVGLHYERQES
jgi:dihydrofolate reductase